MKDLGIVHGFDDKLRPIRSVYSMSEYLEQAFKELEKNAEKLGANAVLGISLSMMDKVLPLIIGSAVYLEDDV